VLSFRSEHSYRSKLHNVTKQIFDFKRPDHTSFSFAERCATGLNPGPEISAVLRLALLTPGWPGGGATKGPREAGSADLPTETAMLLRVSESLAWAPVTPPTDFVLAVTDFGRGSSGGSTGQLITPDA
jgi:hypothetical protein